jgi:hypothetical protein
MTPLPEIDVRRTGYVALMGLDTENDGALHGFVKWLVGMGKSG